MPQHVSFDEVIASWLLDEWHYACFDQYRTETPSRVVVSPNLSNPDENSLRRKILMSNRGDIIGQLPSDTQWFVTSLSRHDLPRIALIPMRKGWVAKLTGGSCRLSDALAEGALDRTDAEDAERIRQIVLNTDHGTRLVFIGTDLASPLTAIEGNHRLVAEAMRAKGSESEPWLPGVYVGISPNMGTCPLYGNLKGDLP